MESKYDTKEPIYKTETVSHVIVKEKGHGKGQTGSLGLVGTDYYTENG